MKILLDDSIAGGAAYFSALGDVRTFAGREVLPGEVADADALIVRSITRVDERLLAGSRVRFVGSATTGADHLDTAYLSRQGIKVALAEGANARTVAEFVISALFHLEARQGVGLAGRVLGIVGAGRIGSRVAALASHVGLRVVRCDPPLARLGTPGLVEFEALARQADIVTLHVPLTDGGPDATRDMVNADWLAALKRGAAFINTSRGEVVREDELIAALETGQVAGAVVDVWRDEPEISLRLAGLAALATPHIAGYSVESHLRSAAMIREALASFAGVKLPAMPDESVEEAGHAVRIAIPRSHASPVSCAVRVARDLAAIDRELRELLRAPDRGMWFDDLRRRCAVAREFSAFEVSGVEEGADRDGLGELGFCVV